MVAYGKINTRLSPLILGHVGEFHYISLDNNASNVDALVDADSVVQVLTSTQQNDIASERADIPTPTSTSTQQNDIASERADIPTPTSTSTQHNDIASERADIPTPTSTSTQQNDNASERADIPTPTSTSTQQNDNASEEAGLHSPESIQSQVQVVNYDVGNIIHRTVQPEQLSDHEKTKYLSCHFIPGKHFSSFKPRPSLEER